LSCRPTEEPAMRKTTRLSTLSIVGLALSACESQVITQSSQVGPSSGAGASQAGPTTGHGATTSGTATSGSMPSGGGGDCVGCTSIYHDRPPPPNACPGSVELKARAWACFCQHCGEQCSGLCGDEPSPDHAACQACATWTDEGPCKELSEACIADGNAH
jgi:hypothetical protein